MALSAATAVRPIYLDHHATTPCDPRVIAAMLPTFGDDFGNAASRQHAFGTAAAGLVERAREQTAALLYADPREIIFTSGATESNNLALKGAAERASAGRRHIVTTTIEHRAVLDPCARLERAGFRVSYVPVGSDGVLRVEDLAAALAPDTFLVSVMLANNEIGTLQPIVELGALCKERGILLHSDAAQALAYVECDVEELGVDLLSISAHKMYGPKGAGALWIRRRRPHVRIAPLFDGGGHERGQRSGTINVPGVVGLGAACELVGRERDVERDRVRALRDRLHARITTGLDGVDVNGSLERRLPNNLNLAFAGVSSDAILRCLDGVAVSSGAACSSASDDGSYVLRSLGGDRAARGSLRFGLGRFTTAAEIERAADLVIAAVRRARSLPAASPGAGDEPGCEAPRARPGGGLKA